MHETVATEKVVDWNNKKECNDDSWMIEWHPVVVLHLMSQGSNMLFCHKV